MIVDGDSPSVARVLPDVSGLDKPFDYLVPPSLAGVLSVGDQVRVPLHGRRVRGWVIDLDPDQAAVSADRLVPIAARCSLGPEPAVVELARWAAWRWGSERVRALLNAASPPRDLLGIGPSRNRPSSTVGRPRGVSLHRVGPLTDPLPIVLAAAERGPTIAIHPSPVGARALGRRLMRTGMSVAAMPDDWALAAAGVDVVVGGRSAAWAPCPGLAAIVLLDEHDDALQEERTPTWHARDVAVERARRAGGALVMVSPVPTATARWLTSGTSTDVPADEQERGWPQIDIVDRGVSAPWQRVSLLGAEVIAQLRGSARVACVHNVPGRSRLLACRACRTLQRCVVCDAAVAMNDDGRLSCSRCSTVRPAVCQACGSSAMANVRPGVSRLREEIQAAAGRAVAAVTGTTDQLPDVDVYVGTEAVLHRVRDLDVVAFLDLDHELFAPRYRSTEHTLALLTRAARLVGGRRPDARLIVQTFEPHHPLLRAVAEGDPARLDEAEDRRRSELRLPPYAALAAVSGDGAGEFARATGLAAAGEADDVLLRADDWSMLANAIRGATAHRGRLRVEVDPPRR